ncbi:MAG TPA: histidine kinase [Flavisolibacter sp.]|jgi:sensor histidine kinase YesM|nr:histidine kinase [Flavisolibacter sp.]
MIKDQLFKCLGIPIVGAMAPFLAQLVHSLEDGLVFTLLTIVYFIGVTFVCWQVVVKLVSDLRRTALLKQHIFYKLLSLLLTGGVLAGAVFFTATWLWQSLLSQAINSNQLLNAALVGAAFGLILVLLYEIIFLSLEKDLDSRVLEQLDRERLEAEVSVLRSELDPHFFFNCMNTLSHLVRNDAEKAYQFVHKLSSVYKYFLRNKEKQYVSLQDEMEFLDNYYFLLRIRFDDNIRIENKVEENQAKVSILPCTLQVLVENAIKHNFFSEKEPLVISIFLNGKFINVSNPVRPKLHAAESTYIGLRNLKARYRIITNQNVLVLTTGNRFLVKLPIVKHENSTT